MGGPSPVRHSETVAVVAPLHSRDPAAGYDDFAVHPATEAGGKECERIVGSLAASGTERATHVVLAPPVDQRPHGIGRRLPSSRRISARYCIGERKLGTGGNRSAPSRPSTAGRGKRTKIG